MFHLRIRQSVAHFIHHRCFMRLLISYKLSARQEGLKHTTTFSPSSFRHKTGLRRQRWTLLRNYGIWMARLSASILQNLSVHRVHHSIIYSRPHHFIISYIHLASHQPYAFLLSYNLEWKTLVPMRYLFSVFTFSHPICPHHTHVCTHPFTILVFERMNLIQSKVILYNNRMP